MSGIHVGLLLHFNVPRLVDGLRRYVMWRRRHGLLFLRDHRVLRTSYHENSPPPPALVRLRTIFSHGGAAPAAG